MCACPNIKDKSALKMSVFAQPWRVSILSPVGNIRFCGFERRASKIVGPTQCNVLIFWC